MLLSLTPFTNAGEKANVSKVAEYLEEYFVGKRNEIFEWYVFNSRQQHIVFVDEACGRGVDVEPLLKTFPFGSFVAGENIQFFGWLKSDGSHASDTM